MKVPGAKTARHFSRWLQARFLGGALILGYHRVAQPSVDSYDVCVSPEHFAEHLDALRKLTNPISLSKLVQHLQEGTLPSRSVAVTFDDGYADNLYHARPLLEMYEVPATVFVSTGYEGREFWWDELDRLVMSSRTEGDALRLEIGSSHFQWNRIARGDETDNSNEDFDRKEFSRKLYNFLLPLDVGDLHIAMGVIRAWSALPPADEADSRAMSVRELLQISENGLIEIGSHTRNHLFLPRLLPERQRQEIISGKQDLEAWLGRPVAGFAYPNGRSTEETRRTVRQAGFSYACTSLPDVVRPDSDLYALTRFWQQDVDGDEFMLRLNRWIKLR